MRAPCATRTIMGADSLTFDVFIITPSVTFSGVASLVLQGRRCSCLRSIPEPIWVPLLSILMPLFTGVRGRQILRSSTTTANERRGERQDPALTGLDFDTQEACLPAPRRRGFGNHGRDVSAIVEGGAPYVCEQQLSGGHFAPLNCTSTDATCRPSSTALKSRP